MIRTAKSCDDWTLNDLNAYSIKLNKQDHLSFFGIQALPPPRVPQELLDKSEAEDMVLHQNVELIHLLHLAMDHLAGERAAADFGVELFRVLGYVHRTRVARTWKDLVLLVCGEQQCSIIDVCLVDRSQSDAILLLLQEDKSAETEGSSLNPEAQLIAKALAAFEENNKNREANGLQPLVETVMPGIVMQGTTPIFYKIPVTQQLLCHVRHGTYPSESTSADYCYPPLSGDYREGMKSLDNRKQILSCFEAFKPIVGI
ncbi:hypothetical protein VKT23_008004 [Stygiomarasmius scandens]|uniref:Uncharacterized protein n=1 Tax=Marasmiellus scandens TaxID=2682957 RepID=A0ABR1JK78_9AGAR